MALAVSQYVPLPPQTLRTRGTLTEDPLGDLPEGVYTLNARNGPFTCTLPSALGQQKRYVFLGRYTDLHPVTIAAPVSHSLNGHANPTYVMRSDHNVVTVVDHSSRYYALYVHGASLAKRRRLQTVPVEQVTQVSGAGTLLYSGTPSVDEVVVTGCTYFDEGVRRLVTLDLFSDVDAPFVLDLGLNVVPAPASVRQAWGYLRDFSDDVGAPAPAVTLVGTRHLRINRADDVNGAVHTRIIVEVENAEGAGTMTLGGQVPVTPLSQASFGLSADFVSTGTTDPINTWQAGTHSADNQITTDGTTFQGFVVGQTYSVTFGVRVEGTSAPFVAAYDGNASTLPGSALLAATQAESSAPSSVSSVTFLFVPDNTGALVIRNNGVSANALADSTFCVFQQLSVHSVVGSRSFGLAKRGTISATPATDPAPGLYDLNSAGGGFVFRLPLASGSFQRHVLVAQDVESNACVLAVQSGDKLNGVLNGTRTLDKNHQVVTCIDVGSQEYWVLTSPDFADGSLARFHPDTQCYLPVSLPGRILAQTDGQVSTTDFNAITTTPRFIQDMSVTVNVQPGDVIEIQGRINLNITAADTVLNYVEALVDAPLVSTSATRYDLRFAGNVRLPFHGLAGPFVSAGTATAQVSVAKLGSGGSVNSNFGSALFLRVYRSVGS